MLSTGWNNPFAFAYTPDGRLWVADNVPGTRGERLARGDLDGRPTHVTPLPPGTAPSGLAAVSDSRLVVCGFQSHLLQGFRITAGQRAVVTGAPIAANCWIGVIRLADGRLAYAGPGATVTITSPSGPAPATLRGLVCACAPGSGGGLAVAGCGCLTGRSPAGAWCRARRAGTGRGRVEVSGGLTAGGLRYWCQTRGCTASGLRLAARA